MGKNTILVIVESPAKCKKIEKFLSKKNVILVFFSEEYEQKDYNYNFKDISK